MKKSCWKHKLIVVPGDKTPDGQVWLTNGHWAVNSDTAERIKGLARLLSFKPGHYHDEQFTSYIVPDVRTLLSRHTKFMHATDTKVFLGQIGGDNYTLRVLKTEDDRVFLIQNTYAEIIEEQTGLFVSDPILVIGSPKKPTAYICKVRHRLYVSEELIEVENETFIGVRL